VETNPTHGLIRERVWCLAAIGLFAVSFLIGHVAPKSLNRITAPCDRDLWRARVSVTRPVFKHLRRPCVRTPRSPTHKRFSYDSSAGSAGSGGFVGSGRTGSSHGCAGCAGCAGCTGISGSNCTVRVGDRFCSASAILARL
jgi:hypothetical protein